MYNIQCKFVNNINYFDRDHTFILPLLISTEIT